VSNDRHKIDHTMKIYHVVFSTSGGAGKSAVRLCEQQQLAGFDAELISLTKGNLRSVIFQHPWMVLLALLDFFVVRTNTKDPLFSLLRNGSVKRITNRLRVDECIVHLHWYAGMVDPSSLAENSTKIKQVVVTLHDMWFFTGGCHQSLECQSYKTTCTNCPQVRNIFQSSVNLRLSEKVQSAKKLPNLTAIAPSQWIASAALQSAALKNSRVRVIPNVLDISVFKPGDQAASRKSLSLKPSDFVIGICAKDLSDPIKQSKEILKHCEKFQILSPQIAVVLLAIGGQSEFLDSNILKIVRLGEIKTDQLLVSAFHAIDVLIVASQIETAPTIIGEASSCGTPVIATAMGGSSEGVIHNSTGKIVSSIQDLPNALIEFHSDRKEINYSGNSRALAEKTFLPSELMSQYWDIYKLAD
jgi:glycosyltransferase involved in cell wall biosynthesis